MTNPQHKSFDCVKSMRKIRDRLSKEIENLNHDELVRWLRRHKYSDSCLQRLADKAAQRAVPADPSSPEASARR